MSRFIRFWKTAALDILGVTLIIISPLLGWLPGPGGIPLFLAGLGLLSINHEWARRLLHQIKTTGFNLVDRFFVDHPVWKAVYDFASFLFMGFGLFLFSEITGNIRLAFALFFFFTGLALFLGNRKRLERFQKWAAKKFRTRHKRSNNIVD